MWGLRLSQPIFYWAAAIYPTAFDFSAEHEKMKSSYKLSCRITKYLSIVFAAIVLEACALPAQAHDPPVSLDDATQRASNIAVILAIMAIAGGAAYFATLALAAAYERQMQKVFSLGKMRVGSGMVAAITMCTLWYACKPIPAVPIHDTAPVKVVATLVTPEETKLYLTPGGAYTEADIAANGSTTPEIKFDGQMANHHLNPKRGTYTCPITKTQANPKFPWIVNGKKYLFCCPPCIAEFVKQAKTKPQSIKEPQAYIQN